MRTREENRTKEKKMAPGGQSRGGIRKRKRRPLEAQRDSLLSGSLLYVELTADRGTW